MEELADGYEAIVAELKGLARKLLIRNPVKLLAAARSSVPGASLRLAKLALEDSVSKQVLRPAFKSTGKSAATGPDEILQADLIDYSQNTKNTKAKFALMLSDVYTREVRAVPMINKRPETVNAAMRELLPSIVEDEKGFAITTDAGKEFSMLDKGGIPAEAVHREKKGTNDISVLDRAMQTVKQDSAAAVADGDAKTWVEALPLAISAHNARPHSAVFGPPENVESVPAQDFRALQENAKKGLLNRSAQMNKSKALREAGAFRAPVPSKRAWEPNYGKVQMLGSVQNDVVKNRGGGEFLLKQVQPVAPGSKEPAGQLTDKNIPRKLRLRERALEVAEHILTAGGRVAVSDLERQVRRGLLNLLKLFRRNRITVRGFLRLYPEIFKTRSGYITVKDEPPPSTPAPVPLAEQIRLSDERNAMLKATRKETAKSRLSNLADVYKL
jgi:hypothetical protein